MPTRYILLTLSIPEEHTDVATGVLSLYPMIGVEMGLDEATITFDERDWQDDYATSIISDLQGAGVNAAIIKQGTEEDQNWNAEWEASIDPVIVNERIAIVPEWKADQVEAPMKLIITPKMSFGTGHHATTRMMCRLMEFRINKDDVWVDVGTGTGVLAILAAKLGASHVYAFDNNEWSILNAEENVLRNGCSDVVKLEQIDLESTSLPSCDGLAANLYRHLVIPYAKAFYDCVKPGGLIVVSGILKYDADEVKAPFLELGCTVEEELAESEWCAIAFRKPMS